MTRFSRSALALLVFLPVVGLSGCGEAPKKEQQTSETAAPEEPAARGRFETVAPENDESGLDAPGSERSLSGETDGAAGDQPKMAEPPAEADPPVTAEAPAMEEAPAVEAAPGAGAEPPPPPAPAAPSMVDSTPEPTAAQPETAAPEAPAPSNAEVAEPAARPSAPSAAAPAPGGGNRVGGPAAQPPASMARKRAKAADKPEDKPDQVFDVVPVYYGTDRAVEADPKRLNFGAERGHRLQLGRALVTVPTAHKVPAIERPWVIEIPYFKVKIYEEKEDPAKHFTLQELTALTKEELLAVVKERLAKSATFKDHAIVFVHGFNTSFDYALYRTAQIAYDLKFDGAPFVYSWPSGGKVASYTYDRGSAEQAEPHLAEFLDLVVKESGAKSISLIAHSMGNEVLLRVLERMRPKAPEGVVISQVILAAPDVDRDKFQNIARQIIDFAQGVTLYAASNDRALRYSASFWGGIPRAGDVPETGPLIVPGVDTIDVSAVSTDSLGLNHSGYAENNALLNDIRLLIQTGQRPPDKRVPTLQPMTTTGGGAYWRYPPAQ
jgi:esterase/lipase superfamily enzyme